MRFEVALFLGVAACGGTISGPIGDGGGTDGTTGSDGTTGNCPGDPPSCFCGSPVCRNGSWGCTSCDDCASLEAQVIAARAELQKCCPTCKSIQCMGTVSDGCCLITTNGADTKAFAALVTKYRMQCKPVCAGSPCPPAPSGQCDPVGMAPNVGRCR